MIVMANERLKRSRLLEELIAITDLATKLDRNRPTLVGRIDIKQATTVGTLLSVSEEQILELQHWATMNSVLAAKAHDLLFDIMALPSCQSAQAFLEPKFKRSYLVGWTVKLAKWLEDLNESHLATEGVFQEIVQQLRNEDLGAIVAVE